MEEKSSRLLAEYLKSILYGPRVEESLNLTEIDESCMELAQGLNDLRSMMEALEEYSAELSKGNLSVKFPEINNILCEPEEPSFELETSGLESKAGGKGRVFQESWLSGRAI